jgi:hypothetical protein
VGVAVVEVGDVVVHVLDGVVAMTVGVAPGRPVGMRVGVVLVVVAVLVLVLDGLVPVQVRMAGPQ